MATRKPFSKRAKILRKVLTFINAGDWGDYDDYIVFGPAPLYEFGDPSSAPEPHPDEKTLRRLAETASGHLGRRLSSQRTSLEAPPDPQRLLDQIGPLICELSDASTQQLLEALGKAFESKSQPPTSFLSDEETEALDNRYCEEVLDKLDGIASRVARLEPLDLKEIPETKLKRYFAEAHRCYLCGFTLACAAMCRAILESALKDIIDPEGQFRPERDVKGKEASYVLKLAKIARMRGLLEDDLVD